MVSQFLFSYSHLPKGRRESADISDELSYGVRGGGPQISGCFRFRKTLELTFDHKGGCFGYVLEHEDVGPLLPASWPMASLFRGLVRRTHEMQNGVEDVAGAAVWGGRDRSWDEEGEREGKKDASSTGLGWERKSQRGGKEGDPKGKLYTSYKVLLCIVFQEVMDHRYLGVLDFAKPWSWRLMTKGDALVMSWNTKMLGRCFPHRGQGLPFAGVLFEERMKCRTETKTWRERRCEEVGCRDRSWDEEGERAGKKDASSTGLGWERKSQRGGKEGDLKGKLYTSYKVLLWIFSHVIFACISKDAENLGALFMSHFREITKNSG